ncbi:MAG: c-type cytochrome [Saprospiraceae bacterium]|nr:c-type cytochrome [Saprospiraceae bacterium]
MSCKLSTETYKQGKDLYIYHCASCHGNSMEGLGKIYPNLIHIDSFKFSPNEFVCLISNGSNSKVDSGSFQKDLISIQMPGIPKLSAIEINNILNYINALHWKRSPFQLDNTTKQLLVCRNISKNERQPQ